MGSMVRMGTESRQERTDERGEVVSGMGMERGYGWFKRSFYLYQLGCEGRCRNYIWMKSN